MTTFKTIMMAGIYVLGLVSGLGIMSLIKGCDGDTLGNIAGQFNQVSDGYSIIDSTLKVIPGKNIIKKDTVKRDTVFKFKTRIVRIHDTIPEYLTDSSEIKILLVERDALVKLLEQKEVAIIDSLQTVFEEYNDSLTVWHEIVENIWTVEMKYGQRDFYIPQTTYFVPIKNNTSIWEHPIVVGIAGFALGYGVNELISDDGVTIIKE